MRPETLARLLAGALTKFHRDADSSGGSTPSAAPAHLQFIQRFGSSVNLHLHVHAVVSDGVFALDREGGGAVFYVVLSCA